jgi:AraC-like DNA-binding protein
MKEDIIREITPIEREDLFIILNNYDAKFDYATHFHSEYELNLVLNTKGKRIIGDSIENFKDCDLVLIAPNVPHAWKGETVKGTHVVTIQFDEHLIDFPILSKRTFAPIKEMLAKSSRGICFITTPESSLCNKILLLCKQNGFNVTLDFFSLLYELATHSRQRLLASNSFDIESIVRESKSRRIAKICTYVNEHYMEPIRMPELAAEIAMSGSALSHFFKKRTNRNLIDYINDIRIGNATTMLSETTQSIGEIAFNCGFNNLSNFNRNFRKIKGQTPGEYREQIHHILTKF